MSWIVAAALKMCKVMCYDLFKIVFSTLSFIMWKQGVLNAAIILAGLYTCQSTFLCAIELHHQFRILVHVWNPLSAQKI